MKFEIITPEKKKLWEKKLLILEKFSGLKAYKEIEYLKLYTDKNVLLECMFIEEKNNFFFMPYLKKKINLDGFKDFYDIESPYGYSGPISNSEDQTFLSNAIELLKEYCLKKNIIACLIRFDPFTNLHGKINDNNLNISYEGDIVYKTLNLENNISEDYNSSIKNKILKAKKNDLSVSISDNYQDFLTFINLYLHFMKQKKANQDYFYSLDYFKKIFKQIKKNFDFFVIHKNGSKEIFGGCIVLKSVEKASIHLSTVSDKIKKFGASVLLRHEITEFYRKKNYKLINYGGGLTKNNSDSLFKFKKNFSKETKPYFIGKLVTNNELYSKIYNFLNDEKKIDLNFKDYLFFYKYAK